MEGIMRRFLLGMLLGSVLTATVGGASSFYDSKGNVKAPRGSVEQFDYFRQRQMFLDIKRMREQQDQQARERKLQKNPC
jgi:hypothetical protein